jgi:CheY-like chemotaxis protein
MKYRTILCEDNESISKVLNLIFQERGHEVFSYEDAGDSPLSFCTECKCNQIHPCADMLISDILMPKVNGLEFVENLKKIGCKIKNIALVSGYWTEEDISRAVKIGCTVIHKPSPPEEILNWITFCEKYIDPQRVLSDIYS